MTNQMNFILIRVNSYLKNIPQFEEHFIHRYQYTQFAITKFYL